MEHLPESPSYLTWVLGQSGMVIVLVAWVWSLRQNLNRSFQANEALQQRNSELASSLVEVVVSSSRERASNNEGNLKAILDSFESALHHKLDESAE